jgi:hypothetical protein
MQIKKLIILGIIILSACTVKRPAAEQPILSAYPGQTQDQYAYSTSPAAPTSTVPIVEVTSTPLVTTTPIPSLTATKTLLPTRTPRHVLDPSNIGFPITWEGPYAAIDPIQYAPCFHYDSNSFDLTVLTPDNWYNFFHAGDMYNLNSESPTRLFTVLSMSSGKVINISDSGPSNGTMIVVETDYIFDNKTVYVSIAHLSSPFRGDDNYPPIEMGSVVTQGQPLGIQETMYMWGLPEQALDIQIRLAPAAEGYPLGEGWNHELFLDPYIYIQDDLVHLLDDGHVVFGYNRQHCLLSGHFP